MIHTFPSLDISHILLFSHTFAFFYIFLIKYQNQHISITHQQIFAVFEILHICFEQSLQILNLQFIAIFIIQIFVIFWFTTGTTSTCLVNFLDDWVCNLFQFFLFSFKFFFFSFLVIIKRIFQIVAITFKSITSIDTIFHFFIFLSKLF